MALGFVMGESFVCWTYEIAGVSVSGMRGLGYEIEDFDR